MPPKRNVKKSLNVQSAKEPMASKKVATTEKGKAPQKGSTNVPGIGRKKRQPPSGKGRAAVATPSSSADDAEKTSQPSPRKTIEEEDFYHGMLPREDVNKMLRRQGDFIVRHTQKKEGEPKEIAISVMWGGKPRHIIPVKTPEGAFYTNDTEFPDVTSLVRYYQQKKEPIKENTGWLLLNPVGRASWEFTRSQIECEKVIGSGAFGEVFLGKLKPNKRKNSDQTVITVAVKICTQGMTKANLHEFMKEARLMRQYNHVNVVKFYGVVAEEPLMIVMEYVSGGSLDKHLRKTPGLTAKELIHYSIGAARGLKYLHSKNCVHRDVAARNCLVCSETATVKISDFGLCHENDYKIDMTKKMPIRWLSPETLTSGVCTFKSDVFSYGVLLWEIFSYGGEPYPGMNKQEVMSRVKSGYRMPPPPAMPMGTVRAVLVDCWNGDPHKRPDFITIVGELTTALGQITHQISGAKTV